MFCLLLQRGYLGFGAVVILQIGPGICCYVISPEVTAPGSRSQLNQLRERTLLASMTSIGVCIDFSRCMETPLRMESSATRPGHNPSAAAVGPLMLLCQVCMWETPAPVYYSPRVQWRPAWYWRDQPGRLLHQTCCSRVGLADRPCDCYSWHWTSARPPTACFIPSIRHCANSMYQTCCHAKASCFAMIAAQHKCILCCHMCTHT